MPDIIDSIRRASRSLVRELGFMRPRIAGTELPASAVHALIEIGEKGVMTGAELADVLNLEKSSVSRMVRKLIHAGKLIEHTSKHDGRAKLLSLTPKGKKTLAGIHAFAREQVSAALANLPPAAHRKALEGLSLYAEALHARRAGAPDRAPLDATIERGYRPGIVGICTEMHARYYARSRGFGYFFESKVAAGLAEFVGRLDRPMNEIWSAVESGNVIGTVAIDGEDLGGNAAHLRWFIMDDGKRGRGLGKRLLNEALSFCDLRGFDEIHLWTVRGLDAARRLYEAAGFTLAEEHLGRQWGTEATEQRFVRRAASRVSKGRGAHGSD